MGKLSKLSFQTSLQHILNHWGQRTLGFLSEFIWLTHSYILIESCNFSEIFWEGLLDSLARRWFLYLAWPRAQLWRCSSHCDACWVTEHGLCFLGHWFLHWGDQGFKLVHKRVSRGLWIKGYEALQAFGWDALAFSPLESFSHFLQPLPSSFQPAASPGKAARAAFKQLLQRKALTRTLTLLLWLLLARASSKCQRYRKPEEHGPRLFQWLRYKKLIVKGELALCSVWKGSTPSLLSSSSF